MWNNKNEVGKNIKNKDFYMKTFSYIKYLC